MLYLETIEERLLMSSVVSPAPTAISLAVAAAAPKLPVITTPFHQQRDLSLSGFTLFNTTTNQSLGALVEGETIDLATLPKKGLSIRANSNAKSVPSILFGYDGVADYHVENYLPYSLVGSGESNYYTWQPTVGSHTVTAVAYASQYGQGRAGTPISVDFNVINTSTVTNFTLINADTNQPLGTMTEGETLNLATLPTQDLAIVVTPNPGVVGSMVFSLDGVDNYHTENFPQYALNGKTWNGYYAWTPSVGAHTVTATPYSAPLGQGVAGTPLTVDFTVIDDANPIPPEATAAVTGFSLIDTDNGQTLSTLTEGQTIDLASLPTQDVSIVANTDISAGSMAFGFDGNSSFQTTDTAPYELNSWTIMTGNHAITATPFSAADGAGDAGAAMTLDFTVIDSTPVTTPTPTVSAVTGFTLVDADNNQPLGPLVEGETIDLATLPTQNLTITAATDPTAVGSIAFGYDGDANFQLADAAPYSLVSWTHALGVHTLVATPFSQPDGAGDAGSPLAVDFQIIDSTPVAPPVVTAPVSITGFELVENDNGQFLGSVTEGAVIDLGTLPTQNVSIIALPSDSVGSVVFGLDGNSSVSDNSPYALASSLPGIGAHSVTATPFTGVDGSGDAGIAASVDFTVIDSSAVTGFFLVDVDNGETLAPLTQGQTIDLSTLPTQNVAIAASTTSTVVNSVLFGYDGNPNFFLQNASSVTPDLWSPTLGSHTITATPYSDLNASGMAGTALTVTFNVIDSSAVSSFTLVDTDNGQSLGSITEGQSIDLGALPTQDLALVANTTPATAGSLVFNLDGTANTLDSAPYTLTFNPTLGSHSVTATPYSAADAAGFAGTALTADFTVIDSTAVTGFTLINADTNQPISALAEGQTIDLHTQPTRDLTIAANTTATVVGSVVFGYDGNSSYQVDNSAPYQLTNSFTATVGAHTISATPYSADNATGLVGASSQLDFAVIDSTPATPPPVTNNPNLTVSITNPINGASQAGPGYYVIRTSTTDTNSTITNVAFYANGTLLGNADAAPFSTAWENAAPGSYTLTAVATDSNGSTTSAPVKVTITAPAVARSLYVSPTGSDSNTGLSVNSPLQTITAAANIAQPGDTVLIEPGTYRESVVVPTSGTSTKPITFQAAVPGTVIIDGADPLGGWTASTGSNPIFTTAWNHDFFHDGSRTYFGFSTDGTTTAVGYAEQFLYNNKPLTQVITPSQMSAGDFYVDYNARTVSVWLPGGATPTSSNMLASTRNHLMTPASTAVQFIRLDGLIFQHASNFAQDAAVQTATGWRILNTTVQYIGTSAINVKGNDVLLYNDHALNNGDTGIDGSGTNDLFVFDETAGNNYKGFSVFNEAGGGKFAQSDGAYFDQYFAHDNIGPGLWFDFKNTNYVVVNSYFYNNKPRVASYEGVGLELEISDGPGRVQGDTFYGNTGAALDICESMNVTAENNTFHNSYLELRDLPNRDPYHIQNINIADNDFDNSFISTSSGTWTTTSGSTKHILINDDIFQNSSTLVYWNSIGYKSLSSIASILGFESNGKLGGITFLPAPSVV